jgi:predicted SprT family Zn-dependent metalloprotease
MSEKIEAAQALALKLMTDFGLTEWVFKFNRRITKTGLCVYPHNGKPGRIELSAIYVEHNYLDAIEDTIRHEIAHALAGPSAKHGPAWAAMCRKTGARPSRCRIVTMPPGKWRSQCSLCRVEYSRYRRPKRMEGWYCRLCGPDHGKLRWEKAG